MFTVSTKKTHHSKHAKFYLELLCCSSHSCVFFHLLLYMDMIWNSLPSDFFQELFRRRWEVGKLGSFLGSLGGKPHPPARREGNGDFFGSPDAWGRGSCYVDSKPWISCGVDVCCVYDICMMLSLMLQGRNSLDSKWYCTPQGSNYIPPNGKFGKSSTQKKVSLKGDMLSFPGG